MRRTSSANLVIQSVAGFRAFRKQRGNWGPLHLMFGNGADRCNFGDDVLGACEELAAGDAACGELLAILRRLPAMRRKAMAALANTRKAGRGFGKRI